MEHGGVRAWEHERCGGIKGSNGGAWEHGGAGAWEHRRCGGMGAWGEGPCMRGGRLYEGWGAWIRGGLA